MFIVNPTPLITRNQSDNATRSFRSPSMINRRLPESSNVRCYESGNALVVMGRGSIYDQRMYSRTGQTSR
jgi:hypothetical protein